MGTMFHPSTFNEISLPLFCNKLARRDMDLKGIITAFGYPPFWTRTPNFETLVYIILEQQVSLASAKAAYLKLKERLPALTPEKFLLLDDIALKACYFSRQKIAYTRHLATSIRDHGLDLSQFEAMDNDAIRSSLTQVKGIGNWTVDVYLMMALKRTNLFPLGDVALIQSLKETKNLHEGISKEEIAVIAKKWEPYQTIAAYMLWHAYLSRRKKDQQSLVPM